MRLRLSPRTTLPLLFLLPIITTPASASEPTPTVGGIALDSALHLRRRAHSLQSLITRTKPTLLWSDTDMLWIDRDPAGRTLFALNHAYQLDTTDPRGNWALFEAEPNYVAAGFVDYTRQITAGSILSTDRHQGSVYLLEWSSRHATGGGPVDSTRHLLVLRTPQGHWQFIGEGPGAADSRAQNKHTTTRTRYEVEWTTDPAAPIILHATRLTCITFNSDDQQAVFESNHDFVLQGKLPARIKSGSNDYLLANYADTLREIALRVATCGTFYPLERAPGLRDRMLRNVTDSLRALNPHLPRTLHPGSRITVPNLSSLWDNANHAAGLKNHPSN